MRPIDNVLSRLEAYRVRSNGSDRWRSCCPAHDGSNPSALSIGIGGEDQVLLRCWGGCTVDQVAAAIGLELHDLFVDRQEGSEPQARRRLLTASQALDLLDAETTLVRLCAVDMSRGVTLDEATRERLVMAAARVSMLRTEAAA